MRKRFVIAAVTAAAVLLLNALPAHAANFSPTISFALSSKKVKANPALTVKVAQDAEEETIAKILLKIPAGFKLPSDAAIEDNELLGTGVIKIATEPLCNEASQATVNVNIREQDRTDAQKSKGVVAVWVVDLRPVTTIELLLKGSVANGWKLIGKVPQNNGTCPPFSFEAKINAKSGQSNKPIIRNPATPGSYTFAAIFTSAQGTVDKNTQTIKIAA